MLADFDSSLFGYSVAIDHGTIVVGAHGVDRGNGSAYVYEQQAGVWTRTARLDEYLPFQTYQGLIGISVAINGDTIALAAPNLSDQSTCGAIVIWKRNSTGWGFSQIVQLPDSFALLNGMTLAMSDTTIVAGTPNLRVSQLDYAGAAYVFNNVNGQWQFQQELTSSSPSHWGAFGQSVAVSGNTILVMASDVTLPELVSSSIHVYHERSNGNWVDDLQIKGLDAPVKTYLRTPVALDGNTILVGSFTGDIASGGIWGGLTNQVNRVTAFELLYPAAPQLSGDFNGDSIVNSSDYLLWRKAAGRSVANYASADANGDGLVDQADYQVWRSHFGQNLSIAPIGLANIPGTSGIQANALIAMAADSALLSAEYSELKEKTLSVANHQIAPSTELADFPVEAKKVPRTYRRSYTDALDRRSSTNLLELIWETRFDPLENITSTMAQVAGQIQHDQQNPSDSEDVFDSVQPTIFEASSGDFNVAAVGLFRTLLLSIRSSERLLTSG